MIEETLNIGIAGAGGFAHFAATAFSEVAGVNIVAVTDINEKAADELAALFKARSFLDYNDLLKQPAIDLVYIATPPHLHYEQSKMALLSGKHVICEKPAALRTCEAEELASLAASHQLLYVVNLMQRYNPLYSTVQTIITKKLLGNFLHGFFENYASDENLNSNHWFWDESKSGGIFIEHGVHFFDMFSGWLGQGKLVNALQLRRPSIIEKINDRVQATVLYQGCIVNFYHGFDQPKILDRQEMRLQFEHGEITLYEWVPVKLKLHGLLQKQELEQICELLKGCSIEHLDARDKNAQTVKGRFSEIQFDHHVIIDYGDVSQKQACYEQMLKAMIADQWMWIKNKNHTRVITDENAVRSLRTAEQAKQTAQQF